MPWSPEASGVCVALDGQAGPRGWPSWQCTLRLGERRREHEGLRLPPPECAMLRAVFAGHWHGCGRLRTTRSPVTVGGERSEGSIEGSHMGGSVEPPILQRAPTQPAPQQTLRWVL